MERTNSRTRGNSRGREVGRVERRICSHAITVSLMLASIFILLNANAVAKGLLLGTLFSIANFLLLSMSIPMTLGKARVRAGLIALGSLLLRYGLLSIPMIVGLKYAAFSFVAVVAGIFSIQIITMFEYVLIRPMQEGN